MPGGRFHFDVQQISSGDNKDGDTDEEEDEDGDDNDEEEKTEEEEEVHEEPSMPKYPIGKAAAAKQPRERRRLFLAFTPRLRGQVKKSRMIGRG